MKATVAVLATLVLGCQTAPTDRTPGHAGSSIALLRDGRQLAVVDPDQGSVSLLDPQTLQPLARIEVGGEPHQLVQRPDGTVIVATYRTGELVAIDPVAHKVVQRQPICAGPWGLALEPQGHWLAVACEWQGEVLRVDSATLTSQVLVSGLRRPRAVAIQGQTVIAAEFVGPDAHLWTEGRGLTRLADQDRTPTQVAAVLAAPDGQVWAGLQLVQNGTPADDSAPSGYGDASRTPKIAPCVRAERVLRYGQDGPPDQPARFNAPSALVWWEGKLLIAHLSSHDVAIVGTDGAVAGAIAVGQGPRGIAVDAGQGIAWVDNAFDASVSRIDLRRKLEPDANVAADLTLVRPLPAVFSPQALAGRRRFHDATDKHMTPHGLVACSSCHPDGGDDGLVWFLHAGTVSRRHRRSMHLAGVRPGQAPMHWDGEFTQLQDLIGSTVTNLMGGDGLLLDSDDIAAYLHEIVRPPLPPTRDPAAVERGRVLFESADVGCATCHGGPDRSDGQVHAVLSPMSLDPQDKMTAARTPSLRGVFLRAPYFHDGRSPDLTDVHTRADLSGHGHAETLTPAQRADLVTYLNSL